MEISLLLREFLSLVSVHRDHHPKFMQKSVPILSNPSKVLSEFDQLGIALCFDFMCCCFVDLHFRAIQQSSPYQQEHELHVHFQPT